METAISISNNPILNIPKSVTIDGKKITLYQRNPSFQDDYLTISARRSYHPKQRYFMCLYDRKTNTQVGDIQELYFSTAESQRILEEYVQNYNLIFLLGH